MTRALLATLAVVLLLPASAQAGRICAPPTHLKFDRKPGAASGRLSWQPPRHAARGTRYRVYRNRAVIGQTKKSWMRIRVSVGRRYRFAVRPVRRNGRLQLCSAGIRKLVPYVLPGAPSDLAVTGASGPAAHLSWSPAKGGDGRVVAYRVLRGDVVFKQVRTTTVDVPLSNSRTYRFAIQSVDAHGKLSAQSNVVTIDSGHQPPPAPATVLASDVTDSELTLSWSPSQPARGAIAGYRVYRDGKSLGQYKGLSTRVTNLAAASSHQFTVAAVDSSGWLSPQSAPAQVSTEPPVPTSGAAQAFLLASTSRSFADFRAHYQQIGVVYPTYFDCSATGDMAGRDDPLVTHWAQQRAVKVLPRYDCQRQDVVHAILADPATRARWLDAIVASVDANGYDGAQLDLEKGGPADRSAMTSFVTELASRLHAQGKLLSVSVNAKTWDQPNHPRSTVWDYEALSQQADWIFVMAWGLHWGTSAPGPQDDLTWLKQVVAYVDTMPQRGRFVLGTQLYAMDWPDGGGSAHPATAWEYSDLQSLIARVGATPQRDATADNMTFGYQDASGTSHEVWFNDATTTHTRIQLAHDNGLGIGFWRLGNEDQRVWDDGLLTR